MKRTKDKSGVVILAVLLGVAVVTAGLAVITHGHNRLVAQAGPDGHPYVGVSVPIGPGVVPAVVNNPGESILTVIAGAATAYAVDKASKQANGSTTATPAISVTGNGNSINVGTGTAKTDNSSK